MMRNKSVLIAVPIILAFFSLITVVGALRVKKSALSTKFGSEAIVVTKGKEISAKISGAERLSARQIVDGLARLHNLPVSVTVAHDGSIAVVGNFDSQKEDVSQSLLVNYSGIMGLLRSLAALPYQAEYKSLCIGDECTGGLNIIIVLLGKK